LSPNLQICITPSTDTEDTETPAVSSSRTLPLRTVQPAPAPSSARQVLLHSILSTARAPRQRRTPSGSGVRPAQSKPPAKPPSDTRQHRPMVYFPGLATTKVFTGKSKIQQQPQTTANKLHTLAWNHADLQRNCSAVV